jgi:putative surface-exposed virulence protein
MLNRFSKFVSLPIIMLALIAAFVFVSPVFADDGLPVDPVPASEEILPPQDVADPVVTVVSEGVTETPVDAPTATETPVDAPADTETVVETPPAPESGEQTGLLDTVAALAENDIELVAQSGEPVAMASRSSSDLVVTGDPYFTVGSVTYRFMKPGGCGILTNCYESTTPIQDALDFMSTNSLTPTDRKLYIEADTYNEDVWVDGTQNGVKGLLGLIGKGATPEDVQINGSLYINDMQTGFSVCNLSVTNTAYADDAAIWAWNNKGLLQLTDVNATATGTDSSGIIIDHTGTVELNRVNASDNGYHGALIYNSGSVKITNSSFDRNLQNVDNGIFYDDYYDEYGTYQGSYPSYDGLEIDTAGPVTLNGVSATGNIGDGADIYAWNSTVSIKNSVFDNNDDGSVVDGWGDGLYINGNIVTLENVQSYNNDLRGIYGYVNTSFTGTHLHTQDNGDDGVQINACADWGDSDAYCDNPGAGTVTINISSSMYNGGDGYDIYAKGLITLNDVYTAGNYGGDGFYLDNSDAQIPAAINLTLARAYNSTYGFEIFSRGAVTLNSIIANANANDGVYIENSGTGAIIINNTPSPLVFNDTDGNTGNGYTIYSNGAVSITNLDTNDNGGLGGYIDNSTAATAAAVTINTIAPANYYNGYWNNGSGGLYILSRGAVTLSRLWMDNNSGVAAEIHNIPPGIAAGSAVSISDSKFNNNFVADGNSDEDGLVVFSKGLITLTNIEAVYNDGDGVYLDNQIPGATGGITINAGLNKGNAFHGNWGDGLVVFTNGAVTMTNLYANNNADGYGVYIDNTGVGGITIKQLGTWNGYDYWTEGNSFSGNAYGGLYITTNGPVTVDLFQARDNHDTGIEIDADGGVGAVTINGKANFAENLFGNWGNGIKITAKGNITLSKLEGGWNGQNGAFLDNDLGTGTVSLTDAYFYENELNGLLIWTTGAVTWKNGSASDNFLYGALIDNLNTLIGKPVTITNVYTGGNGETGLSVGSKGIITLTDVESYNNSANEYTIVYDEQWQDNLNDDQYWWFEGTNGDKVTIQVDTDNFNPWIYVDDPDGNTLDFADGIDGSLSMTLDLTADGWYSIYVGTDQQWNIGSYQISLFDGLTPPGIWSENASNANGINIDNSSGVNAGVTLLNNGYNRWNSNNSGTDVVILSSGAVSLTKMDMTDSGAGGLVVDNRTSTSSLGVTLTNVNFNANDETAAEIKTKGAVVVKTADIGGNGGYGYYIENNSGTVLSPITFTEVFVSGWGSTETGIYLRSKGAITFTNVSSYGNGGSGVDVQTLGAITFTGVEAKQNSNYGALLVNDPGTGTVSLTNAYFDGNNFGLLVLSTGAVTWKNGSASDNFLNGAAIHNQNTLVGKTVTITNVGTYGNGETGLFIESKGLVTLTDVESNNNSADYYTIAYGEEWLDNLTDGQAWWFDGATGDQVTIQVDSSRFNPYIYVTDPDGNFVDSTNGVYGSLSLEITLPADGWYLINVGSDQEWPNYSYNLKLFEAATPLTGTVTESSANGIYVDNHNGVNAGVTILNNGYNRWNSNNSGTDVVILSSGAVALTNIDLNDSSQGGLFVNNTFSTSSAGVTLTNVNFTLNEQTAAEINTKGAVVVKTADVGGNGGYGYYIVNDSGTVLSPITFTDVSVNGWSSSNETGIYLRSKGAVTFTNVTSNGNGGSGLDISTLGAVSFTNVDAGDNNGYGAYVLTPGTFTTVAPLVSYNNYGNNRLTGLYVEAGGKVTLTKVSSSNNGWRDELTGDPVTDGNGIYILNTNTLGTAPIVFTDIYSDGNTLDGTYVFTRGAITVTTLQANYNTGFGLYLNQSTALNSLSPVILNKIITDGNGMDGLYTEAKGFITVNKFAAGYNGGTGVNLINNVGSSTGTVTVLNTLGGNTAWVNGGTGVNIQSNGAVNITGLETVYNGVDGLDVHNNYTASTPLVTLNSIISRYNTGMGIYVGSKGIVTLNNSWSVGSGMDGIHLETTNNVFLNNASAIGNDWVGIYVDTTPTSALKLTNSTWFGNLRNDPNVGDRNLMFFGGLLTII